MYNHIVLKLPGYQACGAGELSLVRLMDTLDSSQTDHAKAQQITAL